MKSCIEYSVLRIVLTVFSAILLILSFPGFNMWIFAWVAFVPLLFAIEGQNQFKAFLISYLTGFLFFLGTMYWLIHVTLLGMIVVVAYLALYFGFFGLILSYGSRITNHERLFLIPSAWVALEWLRSHFFTGFGWNLLGYSQCSNLPIIQIADKTGAYGVSFLIIMFNIALYMSIKNLKSGKEAYMSLVIVTILLLTVFGYGIFRLNNIFTGEKLRVAIIQGNIPQDKKWDRHFTDSILSKYEGLTKKSVLDKAELVIWPETSIPGFVENEEDLFSRIKNLVTDINTPLLAGAPRYEDTEEGTLYYNSAFLFLKGGTLGGHYDKVHLVPFGEYIPLKNLLFFVHRFAPRPIGDYTAGNSFTVFKFLLKRTAKDKDYSLKFIKKVGFSCLVCFEDIFPDLARQFVKKNIDFLVNITNDGWFGKSSAAYQHAQASVFRAVENRINVVRVANTGLSCFIDQKGRVTASVVEDGKDLFVEGFKTHEIVLSRTRTVYTVYGDVFAYICIFFIILNITRRLRAINQGFLMKNLLNWVIFLSITLTLFGCDSNQYQIITSSDGSLYRFNRKTGELSMIMEDNKVVRLAESKKTEAVKADNENPLEKPVNWRESRFPAKNLKARLETVWRENKLCYKFSVYPYKSMEKIFAKKKQDYIYSIMKPGFNIELIDKNGFMVKEIKVNLWNMTKVAGDDGKEKELVINSQIDCTKQSYRSIGGYTIKWLLDPDLIEDEKEDFIKSSPLKSESK